MRKLLRILFWTLAVCALIAGVAYLFVVPWSVPSDDPQFAVSIEPTLSAGEVVLVSRMAGAADGALVRCADPDSPGRFVVGRVIGSVGDKIEFRDGMLMVNGQTPSAPVGCDPGVAHLTNPATQEDMALGCNMEEFAGSTHGVLRASGGAAADRDVQATVDPGKVYLVSDDRVLHLDSRDFGSISPETCHRIVLRLWGTHGWGDSSRRLTILW